MTAVALILTGALIVVTVLFLAAILAADWWRDRALECEAQLDAQPSTCTCHPDFHALGVHAPDDAVAQTVGMGLLDKAAER